MFTRGYLIVLPILLPFSVGNPRVSHRSHRHGGLLWRPSGGGGGNGTGGRTAPESAAVETPVGWGKNGEIH